jgi:hypothetical protein
MTCIQLTFRRTIGLLVISAYYLLNVQTRMAVEELMLRLDRTPAELQIRPLHPRSEPQQVTFDRLARGLSIDIVETVHLTRHV